MSLRITRLGGRAVAFAAAIAGACADKYALPPPHFSHGVSGPGSPALHAEALRELGAARVTAYRHEMHIDEDRGIFEYDCSGFVDYAISNVAPDALDELRHVSRSERPIARTFVELFAAVEPGQTRGRWIAVVRVPDLRPGDVVAWLSVERRKDYLGIVNSGHVLIVDTVPQERAPGEWLLPVIDATSRGHGGADTRTAPDANGVGRGCVVLLAQDGIPIGYSWTGERPMSFTMTRIAMERIL